MIPASRRCVVCPARGLSPDLHKAQPTIQQFSRLQRIKTSPISSIPCAYSGKRIARRSSRRQANNRSKQLIQPNPKALGHSLIRQYSARLQARKSSTARSRLPTSLYGTQSNHWALADGDTKEQHPNQALASCISNRGRSGSCMSELGTCRLAFPFFFQGANQLQTSRPASRRPAHRPSLRRTHHHS